jgi:hypothetical protein
LPFIAAYLLLILITACLHTHKHIYTHIYAYNNRTASVDLLYLELLIFRGLRRIFGPKRDGVLGGWRKLHNEELHNLYFLPSIIRIIKSRRMRCGMNGGEGECV